MWCSVWETDTFSPGSCLTGWCDRDAFHRESSLLHSTLEKQEPSVTAVPQITGGWPCISTSMLPAHHRDYLFLCFQGFNWLFRPSFLMSDPPLSQSWSCVCLTWFPSLHGWWWLCPWETAWLDRTRQWWKTKNKNLLMETQQTISQDSLFSVDVISYNEAWTSAIRWKWVWPWI